MTVDLNTEKYLQIILRTILFCTLILLGCDDGSLVMDGDTEEEMNEGGCPEESLNCVDDILYLCHSGEWELYEDCLDRGEICVLDACSQGLSNEFEAYFNEILQSGDIELDYGEANADYILVPFYLQRRNVQAGYEIHMSGNGKDSYLPTPSTRISSNLTVRENPGKAAHRFRLQRDMEMRLRDRELWRENSLSPAPIMRWKSARAEEECSRSSQCASDEICNDGSCSKQVSLAFDAWTIHTQLEAQVIAKGKRCVLLVETADVDDLSEEEAAEFLEACDQVIVPRNRFFFGDPTVLEQGEAVDMSDRDGDGLLQVLFSNKVNEEGVWGFFSSADFYPDSTSEPSNERDLLYVSLPTHAGEIESIKATIIHEYQHLLHFVNHNWAPYQLGRWAESSPVWLDEACSHLSEEIGGYGIDNPTLVEDYLLDFPKVAFAYGSDTLQKRAMGMLLMLYLFEQAGGVRYLEEGLEDLGGAAFLQEIVFDQESGIKALENSVGRPLEDFFFDWLVTIAVGDRRITENRQYTYSPIQIDPLTGQEIGVRIRGERTSSDGSTIWLFGPTMNDLTIPSHVDALQSTGAHLLIPGLHSGNINHYVNGPDEQFFVGVIRLY